MAPPELIRQIANWAPQADRLFFAGQAPRRRRLPRQGPSRKCVCSPRTLYWPGIPDQRRSRIAYRKNSTCDMSRSPSCRDWRARTFSQAPFSNGVYGRDCESTGPSQHHGGGARTAADPPPRVVTRIQDHECQNLEVGDVPPGGGASTKGLGGAASSSSSARLVLFSVSPAERRVLISIKYRAPSVGQPADGWARPKPPREGPPTTT